MSQMLSAALGIPLWFFQQEQGKGCDGAVIGFKGALDP